jgi:hypothetical protein
MVHFVWSICVSLQRPLTILDMRIQSLEIRLTDEEKGILQEKAHSEGLTLSAWVRKELFPQEPIRIPPEAKQLNDRPYRSRMDCCIT